MLDHLKLGTKLVGGFAAVALLTALMGLAGIYSMGRMMEGEDKLAEHVVVPFAHSGELGWLSSACATICRRPCASMTGPA